MDWESFFTLHRDLPREGPGERADVEWVFATAQVPTNARILDAGCGPGGDIAALLAAAPQASLLAVDSHAPFVDQVKTRFGHDPRVTARAMPMQDCPGRFDLIWCAGALYFLGLEAGLGILAQKLAPGGVLAFSEPCFFTPDPSPAARAFWEDHPTRQASEIAAAVADAGLTLLDQRPLGDAAWEAYFGPLEDRIAQLRPEASASLSAILDENEAEAQNWRRLRLETGYLLSVARRDSN